MVLVGIVDLDKGAIGRVTSFAGPSIPAFTDLDDAIRTARPDAAIIGTPPSSHVPLAKKLLAAGVDVLVEKPVAASVEDRDALAAALDEHPERYVGTGYLSGLLPHLAAIAPELRKGRFGTPQRFDARAFVSRVDSDAAEQQEMWELDPSISGGGALVNLGVHVLAMLDVLLGPIEVDDAVLVAAPGRATEDGAALELRAGGVPGRFATAWHLPGFDMPENHLRIDTDRGVVVCTTSCAAFIGDDEVHVVHQVDADRGFDLAPMDAGGAFWGEQDLLARREDGPNSLELAARIEDAIGHVYATAARVETPAVPTMPSPAPDPRGDGRVDPRPAGCARRRDRGLGRSRARRDRGPGGPGHQRRDRRPARRARPLPHADQPGPRGARARPRLRLARPLRVRRCRRSARPPPAAARGRSCSSCSAPSCAGSPAPTGARSSSTPTSSTSPPRPATSTPSAPPSTTSARAARAPGSASR